MFIKPVPGRKVRCPGEMRLLSQNGEEVPNSFYWQRLKNNGDVLEIEVSSLSRGEKNNE